MINKYKCVRTCFAYGRKWDEGEIMDFDFTPNHHFVIIGKGNEPEAIKVNSDDPMKVTESSEVTSFSQAQKGKKSVNIGMASGLSDEGPINSPKELKKNKVK